MIDPACPDFADSPVDAGRPRFDYALSAGHGEPCVSIVTPFYNADETFHETARSVFAQSLQQWEWIIVNDGTTAPNSLRILDDYRNTDTRVRIIDHPSNRGLSAARNTGFRAAHTAVVVQLDSDDLLETTAVEKWLWFLESYPEYGFVKGHSVGFGAKGYLWTRGFDARTQFLDENQIAPTGAIRTVVHHEVGGYDEAIRHGLEDWEFWLRCAFHGHWGGTIPEFLDWYRRREDHASKWPNWDGAAREREFRKRLRERYGRLWEGGFPNPRAGVRAPNGAIRSSIPFRNVLVKQRRRLLCVVPWFQIGGADTFLRNLAAELVGRGWEVTIAATLRGEQPWLPLFTRITPDVFVLPHFLRVSDYPRFLDYLIESRRPDVVCISHSEFGFSICPYLKARHPRLPFVGYSHVENPDWKNGGYARMAVLCRDALTLNVVASQHLRDWMIERGAEAERVRVCYIGVDTRRGRHDPVRRSAVRRDLGIASDTTMILYVGRICGERPPQPLAETAARLAQCDRRWRLVVAGDGGDRPWLESFIAKRGLADRVTVLGAVPNDRVHDLMQAADVFFLPSRWEGIAMAIYEAMACGLAVVGTAVGGQAELVSPDCGILISRSDEVTEAEQYAAALGALIADPERRRGLGAAARRRVDDLFRLDRTIDAMIESFDWALDDCSRSGEPPGLAAFGRLSFRQAVEYAETTQALENVGARADVDPGAIHVPRVAPAAGWRGVGYRALRRWFGASYQAAKRSRRTWVVALGDAAIRLFGSRVTSGGRT